VILNFDGGAATCSGANAYGTDPVQVLIIANPADSGIARTPAQTVNLQIGLVSGTAPGRIKVVVDDDGAGSSIDPQFQTNSPTIQGHANAANAGTLGAAFFANTPPCGVSPATPEWYTSTGGEPVLFDANGNPQTPETRQKPDFTGPDGVNTTFFGWAQGVPNNSSVSECRVNTAYPSFFGTSAATPHAAGVAALMLQYNPSLTPAQIFTFLRNTAAPMGTVPNFQSGYGFIQAEAAFAQVPAPPAGAARFAPASSSGSGGGGAVDAATLAALGMLLVLGSIRRRSRPPLLQCRERAEERSAIG
jgi:subtilisin family serine protease